MSCCEGVWVKYKVGREAPFTLILARGHETSLVGKAVTNLILILKLFGLYFS